MSTLSVRTLCGCGAIAPVGDDGRTYTHVVTIPAIDGWSVVCPDCFTSLAEAGNTVLTPVVTLTGVTTHVIQHA